MRGVRVSVNASARGRALAAVQSRGDGAGSGMIRRGPRRFKAARVFCCVAIILVKPPERRLWARKREDRRAFFARRSSFRCFCVLTSGIGNREGPGECGSRLVEKPFHPPAFARGGTPGLGRCFGLCHALWLLTDFDAHVLVVEAQGDGSVQPCLDAQLRTTHPCSHLVCICLVFLYA